MKSTAKAPRTTRDSITLDVNTDIDWTPASQRLYPRILSVKRGKIEVSIEESSFSNGKLAFLVSVGEDPRGRECRYNVASWDCGPTDLDVLIELLTIARDKAKTLGMPSAKRPPISTAYRVRK